MSEDFKHQASQYVKFRPLYPVELFDWLGTVVPCHDVAWDCATGNGQAALGLTKYFSKVIATDVNQTQLDEAIRHPNIEYRCISAENRFLEPSTVDLVTVACGVHWFNREVFYQHVRESLKSTGLLAVWTYDWPWSGYKKIDALLSELKGDILGKYWTEAANLYFNKYENLDFPFQELSVPSFASELGGTVDHLLGFLSTWSAVQRFKRDKNEDPIRLVESSFREAWNQENPAVPLYLPLHFKVGKVN
jgi:SAM-dependent methyltransferase